MSNRSMAFHVFRLLFLLLACAALLSPKTAQAQAAAPVEAIDNSSLPEGLPSKEALQDLIVLLESQSAREELIAQLKSLQQVQEEETGDSTFSLSDMLRVDDNADVFMDEYAEFLESLGLSDNEFGKIVATVLALILILLLVWLNRWLSRRINRRLDKPRQLFRLAPERFALIPRLQKNLGTVLAVLLAASAIAIIWDQQSWFGDSPWALPSLFQLALSLALIIFIFAAIWELLNAGLEYYSHRHSSLSMSRLNTVVPVMKKILMITLGILFFMVSLSEIGVDIMPLLAGAGVIGIAVGFGAQTLVKDFLTGLIIILEDILQVGDVVTVGDRSGMVERITIRKIQLRGLDGTVHTVPYSELTVIDNMTKEFSYYLTDIGVAYKENVAEVIDCIREVDQQMREDDDYKDKILEEIDILGLDKFADSAVVIRARIKTQAHAKWSVGRAFNARLKQAFDERNIEIPFPHRTLFFANPLEQKGLTGSEQKNTAVTAKPVSNSDRDPDGEDEGEAEGH